MRLAPACLLLFFAGCSGRAATGSVSQAIIGGDADPGDPAVVMIQAHVPGSSVGHLCSGALVSPRVVLTAAHCVDPATVGDGAGFLVFDGAVAATAPTSQFHPVSEVHFDAQFNPDKNVFPTAGHDIGVVVLKSPLTTPPLRYNHAPVSPSLVGQPARLVGYGVTDGSDSSANTAGTRRTATTKLTSVNDVLITLEDGTHNICQGDSGGPAFMTLAGVDTIAGVTAFGDANCNPMTPGSDTRVDRWAAFVDGWVMQLDPPARTNLAVGASCTTDLECASKVCAAIGGTSFCAESCSPGSPMPCPSGLVCASIDEDPLCAPANLAVAIHTGCAFAAGGAPPAPSLPWLLPSLLVLLARARRRSMT